MFICKFNIYTLLILSFFRRLVKVEISARVTDGTQVQT